MNDFLHGSTCGIPADDLLSVTELASTYLQEGESILEIRATESDRLQVDIGIVINKRAGSGRKLTVEKAAGNWTVTDVRGWIG